MSHIDERKAAVARWVISGFEMASTEGLDSRELLEASMTVMCCIALEMGTPLSSLHALVDDLFDRAKRLRDVPGQ